MSLAGQRLPKLGNHMIYLNSVQLSETLGRTGQGTVVISFNSAGPVTRYRPAEILISALSEFGRDKARNTAPQAAKLYYVETLITKRFRH